MVAKRSLVIILVAASVVVFVGLVWLIARAAPLVFSSAPSPSYILENRVEAQKCTYPVSYWRDHPELYPAEVVLGDVVYKPGDLQVILASSSSEIKLNLQAQLIAVFLNSQSADTQGLIEEQIYQAYSWLLQHPDGDQLSASEQADGITLVDRLEAYNMGEAGVEACQVTIGATTTLDTAPTGTAKSLPVTQPGPITTPVLTPTATMAGSTQPTAAYASSTPRPTTEVPGVPPPNPTDTVSPSKTYTPKEPTLTPVTPSATATKEPSATKTPLNTTQAPSPTASLTPIPSDTPTKSPAPTITAPVDTPTTPPLP